jgi:hypothetical protein
MQIGLALPAVTERLETPRMEGELPDEVVDMIVRVALARDLGTAENPGGCR